MKEIVKKYRELHECADNEIEVCSLFGDMLDELEAAIAKQESDSELLNCIY